MSDGNLRVVRAVRRGRGPATASALGLALALAGTAILIAVGQGGLPPALADSGPLRTQQATYAVHAPNLQTSGVAPYLVGGDVAPLDLAGGDAALLGMDGMGESELELQNLTARSVHYDGEFLSTVTTTVRTSGVLAPLGGTRFSLNGLENADFSSYGGTIAAEGAIGAIVRTTWFGGASSTFEAIRPATSLIVPLVAYDVYSHTSILYIQNLEPKPTKNPLLFELFDTDGSILESWTFNLKDKEALSEDMFFSRLFYEPRLPKNAAGGFLGAFSVTARDPVAIMIYGDEPIGTGAYALSAQSRSAANRSQYLPLIRANSAGDSLIQVMNGDFRPADVTITYRGHPASPSGADQTFTQSFRLAGNNPANIDLGTRGRGNVDAPANLPRGTAPDEGFLGSATISASAPVLASVWEQYLEGDRVNGSAAYNGFGPADMGTVFVVPHAFGTPDQYPTVLAVLNPSDQDAIVTRSLITDNGEVYAQWRPTTVPGGGGMVLLGTTLGEYAHVRVLAESTVPVVVLVLDALPVRDRTAHKALRLDDSLRGAFPTPPAPITPTAGPTSTATPLVSPTRPTTQATPTSSLERVLSIYLPAVMNGA